MIRSINFNQHEILKDIIFLYCKHGIDCDATYSKGNFYRNGVQEPRLKFDLVPQKEKVVQANFTKLPLPDNCIASMIIDPPFLINGSEASIARIGDKDGSNLIYKRFSAYQTKSKLLEDYRGAIKESFRVLDSGGVFIFKCQDTVSSGKNHFNHCEVYGMALENGFVALDLFVLLAKSRMSGAWKTQVHARKFHSYFWVFKKP